MVNSFTSFKNLWKKLAVIKYCLYLLWILCLESFLIYCYLYKSVLKATEYVSFPICVSSITAGIVGRYSAPIAWQRQWTVAPVCGPRESVMCVTRCWCGMPRPISAQHLLRLQTELANLALQFLFFSLFFFNFTRHSTKSFPARVLPEVLLFVDASGPGWPGKD